MIQKPRGTLDILPGESEIWQEVERKIKKVASLYGFREIRLPTFEMSELYKRGVGETSDVVQKEMYSFNDNDRRNITLRPEGTAGVVRSVIENSLGNGALPLALYYLISCFRYEKPEAGRSREFYQFGVELFGAKDASADANVISLAAAVFRELGLTDVHLEINSIGCPDCRPKYHKALREYFEARKDELCPTCLERLDKNPLRILDCKSPICKEIGEGAPKTVDHLCPECEEHFNSLKKYLDAAGIEYFYTLIDDAVARVVRSEGGYIWACKNYDGDVMSDMVATAYGSLAMMTSVLVSPDGTYEYEAAHGTVQRHYYKHLKGEETSTNSVATLFAWTGALRKRGELDGLADLCDFANKLEKATIKTIEDGTMTGDLYLLSSLENKKKVNTEDFLHAVNENLKAML